MNYLEQHIQSSQKSQIRILIIEGSLQLILPVGACLFFFFLTRSELPLYILAGLVIFILLVPVVRWRNHFKDERIYANRFANLLEDKDLELKKILVHLKDITSSSESHWLDFILDPSTFQINLENLTNENGSKEINQSLTRLIEVDATFLSNFIKQGHDGGKLILSIELILKWFSHNWIEQELDRIISKATLRIKDGIEFYNLKKIRWENEQGEIITEPNLRYDQWL